MIAVPIEFVTPKASPDALDANEAPPDPKDAGPVAPE
jgi:hypothetical protein